MATRLPLNLYHLKYFCDAVKYESVSVSAQKNFVSQSAVSQAIQNLEKSLNKELITHQANKFEATPEGRMVFEKAYLIFDGINGLEESLLSEEGVISGRVNFVCTHSFALALLPSFLNQIRMEWPKLHVNFMLSHTDVIKELIKKGIVDFGIVLDNEDLSAYECKELYAGEYSLYRSSMHNTTLDLPFILSEERHETNLLKNNYKKLYKKDMNVLMEVSSWEVIASLTEEGLAIGFFPDYVARRRKHHLKKIPYKMSPIKYKILALFSKNKKIHKNSLLFIDRLKSFLSEQSEEKAILECDFSQSQSDLRVNLKRR
jgi:DNA-binding transcriptional LysR family regulator